MGLVEMGHGATALASIQKHLPGINMDIWESKHTQRMKSSVFLSHAHGISCWQFVLLWHGFQVVLPQLQDP